MTPNTQPATVTEATARQLMESIHGLEMLLAVTTEQLKNQTKWNDEQEKINVMLAGKIAAIENKDVATDERIKYIEGWRNWINGVFTAILVVVLIAVAVASLTNTYGLKVP